MILTVRELVDHLGMNPKTEIVGASTMVKVLERLGAIKKVGSRPVLDENGKQTIGRPSALYEFPETVSFKMPESPLAFVAAVRKERKKSVETVADEVMVAIEAPAETVLVEAPVVEQEADTEVVEYDFGADDDELSALLNRTA
jgi:hypothetical protein